jgi:hypothetical protein
MPVPAPSVGRGHSTPMVSAVPVLLPWQAVRAQGRIWAREGPVP